MLRRMEDATRADASGLLAHALACAQIRVARPTADLARARAFYETALGLPVVAAFEGHDGFDGVVLGLPDASRQLELVHTTHVVPAPTAEDQLVLYLGSAETVGAIADHLERNGHTRRESPNPYWQHTGAACFVDPDGYWLVLSPQRW